MAYVANASGFVSVIGVVGATLTVTKVLVNDNGGTAVVGDFTLRIDGGSVTSGVANTVTVGAHVVSEDAFAGYTATIGGDCDAGGNVTLALGESKTCTITNDDDAPSLDTTPPVSSIDSGPALLTNSTSATFTFSGTDDVSAPGDLTFECQLDGGGFASCTSPDSSSSGLGAGSHTFEVRATDEAGNTESTATFTWTVDLTDPQASIDSGPADPTNSTSATFTFSGTDDVSAPGDLTFECQLDSGGFVSCTSPDSSTTGLVEGSHTFEVRATDEAGNTESTATFTWTVDLTDPQASIDSGPADPTNSTSATFTFSGTDDVSASSDLTFDCQLDSGGFASCTSPDSSTTGLGAGSHTFEVRATDEAGNTESTATFTWTVDLSAPVITLNGDANVTVELGDAYVEQGAVVTDNVDSGLTAAIDATAVNTGAVGVYSVTYDATDTAGNDAVQVTRTVNVEDTEIDSDGDGVIDEDDNAPNVFNPDQSDIDGDGVGDVIDPCPSDPTDTCDPSGSAAASIGPDGGFLATPDGSVGITVPSGALDEDTTISMTSTGSLFELTTNRGEAVGVFGVDIQPEGTDFLLPITIVFAWDDADNDGVVDGTNIREGRLLK